MKTKVNIKDLCTVVKALLSTFAIVSTPHIPWYEDALMYTNGCTNPILTYIAKWRLFVNNINPMLGFLCFILLYYLYRKNIYQRNIIVCTLSAFFSVFMVVGMSIQYYDNLSFINKNFFQMTVSMVIWLGFFSLFIEITEFIFGWLDSKMYIQKDEKNICHIFIKSFAVLVLCWFPYWYVFYPGSVMWDALAQFNCFFGVYEMSDWHPVFSTVVYGIMMKAGKALGSDNMGVAFCVLYQYIILASAISYGMYVVDRWGVCKRAKYAFFLFFALMPLIAIQAQSVMKDVSYYAFILVFGVTYLDLLSEIKDGNDILWKKIILLITSGVLSGLFRHNGIYCCVLSCIMMLFRRNDKKKYLQIGIALAAIFILTSSISNILVSVTGATPKSQGEMMSIPFQQIARYVKDYDNEITLEDKQIINGILKYDDLSELYDSNKADPVKNTYTGKKIGIDFWRVWLKGLIKHPGTYVEAFLCNTYSYFYPNGESTRKPMVYDLIVSDREVNTGYFDIYYRDKSFPMRNIIDNVLYILNAFPGIGMLFHQGWYTWLFLLYCAYIIEKKLEYGLIATAPVAVHLLVCLASPINGYIRYSLSVILLIPFLLAWGCGQMSNVNKLEE